MADLACAPRSDTHELISDGNALLDEHCHRDKASDARIELASHQTMTFDAAYARVMHPNRAISIDCSLGARAEFVLSLSRLKTGPRDVFL